MEDRELNKIYRRLNSMEGELNDIISDIKDLNDRLEILEKWHQEELDLWESAMKNPI